MNIPTASNAGAGWAYPTPDQPIAAGPHRPHPQPPPQYASPGGWPGVAHPPYGAPHPPYGPPPPPSSSPPPPYAGPPPRRRTGLAVGLIAGGAMALTLVVGLAVLLVTTFTRPQTLTSANGVVTIQVPGSWTDLSSADAGQSYTAADEEDQWTVPDLETEDFAGDAHLSLWVSDSADDAYTVVQKDLVATSCDLDGCLSRGTPTVTTVAGRPAVQQLLRHPATKASGASSSLVVSLSQDRTVVSLVLWWDEWVDPDSAALLRSITLTR